MLPPCRPTSGSTATPVDARRLPQSPRSVFKTKEHMSETASRQDETVTELIPSLAPRCPATPSWEAPQNLLGHLTGDIDLDNFANNDPVTQATITGYLRPGPDGQASPELAAKESFRALESDDYLRLSAPKATLHAVFDDAKRRLADDNQKLAAKRARLAHHRVKVAAFPDPETVALPQLPREFDEE